MLYRASFTTFYHSWKLFAYLVDSTLRLRDLNSYHLKCFLVKITIFHPHCQLKKSNLKYRSLQCFDFLASIKVDFDSFVTNILGMTIFAILLVLKHTQIPTHCPDLVACLNSKIWVIPNVKIQAFWLLL